MNTKILALGVAIILVIGLLVSLGILNLLVGALTSLFEKPKFTFLKSVLGKTGFAFSFDWNQAKDPVTFHCIKLRLFNPFGHPSQIDVIREFEGKDSSFALDLDLGPSYEQLLNAKGLDDALVQIEVSSVQEGFGHQIEMKGAEFREKLQKATQTAAEMSKLYEERAPQLSTGPVYGVIPKDTVADTVPGKGAVLKLATNPLFAGGVADAYGGGGAEGASGKAKEEAKKENFKVEKVWIAPGCIVCNACEDIYPEVFDVQANTCLIRPNPPLDDGLRIQEAAEACPVEVIKFTKAAG